MTLTKREMEIVFFRFWKGELSIQDFEQRLYVTPELEGYLGPEIYYEFISFNFHETDARHAFLKLVEPRLNFPRFYTWDIQRLLAELLDESQDAVEIFEELYRQYGEYRFLKSLHHGYLLGIDEIPKLKHRELWREAEFEQQRKKLADQVVQLKPEIKFLIRALETGGIRITGKSEYEIEPETEKQLNDLS